MLDLEPWAERIRTAVRVDVKPAADLGAAKLGLRRDAAFVLPLYERAVAPEGEDQTQGGLQRQMMALGVGVVLAVRNRRDRRGGDALAEMRRLRQQVRNALFGWQPDGAFEAVMPEGGELLELVDDEGLLLWQDAFRTRYLAEQAA